MNKKRLEALQQTLFWLRDVRDKDLPAGTVFDFGQFCEHAGCQTHMCLAGWYVHQNPRCELTRRLGAIMFKCLETTATNFSALGQHFDLPEEIIDVLFRPPVRNDYRSGLRYDLKQRRFWARRVVKQLQQLQAWQGEPLKYDSGGNVRSLEFRQLLDEMHDCQLEKAPVW